MAVNILNFDITCPKVIFELNRFIVAMYIITKRNMFDLAAILKNFHGKCIVDFDHFLCEINLR